MSSSASPMNTSATPPPRRNTSCSSTRALPPCSVPGQAAGLARLLSLAAAGRGDSPSAETIPTQRFAPGPRRKIGFVLQSLLVRRKRNMVDEDLEPFVPRELRRMESRIPRFDWNEEPAGDWHSDQRQIAIYVNEQIWRKLDTDRGLNFLTVLSEADQSTRKYTVLWIPPDSATHQFLFRVRTPTGSEFCSRPFTLAEIRSQLRCFPYPRPPAPALKLRRAETIGKSAPRSRRAPRSARWPAAWGRPPYCSSRSTRRNPSARRTRPPIVHRDSRMVCMSDHRHVQRAAELPVGLGALLPRLIQVKQHLLGRCALHLHVPDSGRRPRPAPATSRSAREPDSE